MQNYVISAQWLREHLEDPQVVIVDCRFSLADAELGKKQYQNSHIPGARYLDLNLDLSSSIQTHGGRHPLPDSNTLAQKLAAMGINFQNTLVVAYDDSRFAFASRLWWLLRYFGHDRVAVLDGGFTQWVEAGYPVTQDLPIPKVGNFTPQVQVDWVVDIAGVKTRQHLAGVVLVDSREGDRYRGDQEPIDPIAGHIPGAVNYPWQDASNPNGYLQPIEDQRQRWRNLDASEEIIVYCGSGVTACVNLLSLELAGVRGAKLYAGSWSDWCSYQGLGIGDV
ncbi:sulfurtransferase [Merismopedia glauca CCAP 1448/3]|uniref:Sulfurtransferase n=2 Tax=Merismopedia TaxID=53402 RepID=A0A2T1C2R9_9CYAN|nr:sulfurtransferase [Merismopedia glauca CCAP 1448/3]